MAELALKGLFVSIAKDPRLIPGVYRYCDEWCARCGVTDRCLSFRSVAVYRKMRKRAPSDPTFADTSDAVEFSREVALAEGTSIPELDAVSKGAHSGLKSADPLSAWAWEYALGVSLWLIFTPADLRRFAQSAAAAPEEVVLWHHLRIYLKLARALVARERGQPNSEDADGCAKAALVSTQKSRQALLQIKRRSSPSQAESLIALLDRIERGIDERFPHARAFIRVGLDVPAA